jgi:hypothetical protein
VAIDPGLRRLILPTLLPAFPGLTAPQWAVDLVAEGLGGYVLFYYNIADTTQLAALTGSLREAATSPGWATSPAARTRATPRSARSTTSA